MPTPKKSTGPPADPAPPTSAGEGEARPDPVPTSNGAGQTPVILGRFNPKMYSKEDAGTDGIGRYQMGDGELDPLDPNSYLDFMLNPPAMMIDSVLANTGDDEMSAIMTLRRLLFRDEWDKFDRMWQFMQFAPGTWQGLLADVTEQVFGRDLPKLRASRAST